ncbi:cobalamin biosynthesis protein [Nocardia sp. CNY236]|uniref:cobalamin biosynthesis protein n=1 Tax=Nocardia sp. CNY236 TaxID=1169152 RepID=UPI0003FEE3FD|nr:cobalamin biosynthesis protein [Nocardia sp. CNY236]
MRKQTTIAVGLLLGFALDRLAGDPRRWHPVAGFGSAAAALESVTYADRRTAGLVHETVAVGTVIGLGVAAGRGIAATTIATWTVLGGRSLVRTGRAMADRLAVGDVAGARALLPALCGRDPEVLDAEGLTRAAIESVAENTSDAAVAPLVWGAVAGVPGLLGYRAINTLDAMVGYRNARYRHFGWAAARTDDIANLAPARITGLLTVVLAPIIGGHPATALRAWRRQGRHHPSPNAGVVEASMAGALGVGLGGRTRYPHGVELRPRLGDGPAPDVEDLRRAVHLSEVVQLAAALLAAAVVVVER